MAFSLNDKIVLDADGVVAYPKLLSFSEMREGINMKVGGSITTGKGVILKAPFTTHVITYGASEGSPSWYSQLIYDNDEEIGALNTYYIDNKLHETFQTCRKYKEVYDVYAWSETEDDGYVFVQFKTAEELLAFIKEDVK